MKGNYTFKLCLIAWVPTFAVNFWVGRSNLPDHRKCHFLKTKKETFPATEMFTLKNWFCGEEVSFTCKKLPLSGVSGTARGFPEVHVAPAPYREP